jgi:hypothetical protein
MMEKLALTDRLMSLFLWERDQATVSYTVGLQFAFWNMNSSVWALSTVVFQPTLIQNHFFDFDGLFYSF